MNKVDLWVQDESRVGQQGSLTRVWAEKGTRPRIPRQQQFLYEYIYGAVCTKRQKAIGLVLPYADREGVQLLLNEIALETPSDRMAIVIMDGAGWHHCKELAIPNTVRLLFLPPYSPELNPIEQVWQYLKDKFLANRTFDSLDNILDACCEAWNAFANNPSLISTLTTRDWITL